MKIANILEIHSMEIRYYMFVDVPMTCLQFIDYIAKRLKLLISPSHYFTVLVLYKSYTVTSVCKNNINEIMQMSAPWSYCWLCPLHPSVDSDQ